MAGSTFEREVALKAKAPPGCDGVFSPDALAFVGHLVTQFEGRVDGLRKARREAQRRRDEGAPPGFLAETARIREARWTVAPAPAALLDRRVEITAPVDRKMIVRALGSGAQVFMADFEDSLSPTWGNVVRGQQNLLDAVAGTIRYDDPATGTSHGLPERQAALFVRPRGWHLSERHVTCFHRAVPAALLDAGLFLFHNGQALASSGRGPYLYLPKLESHLEARLWNDVLGWIEGELALPRAAVRVAVLIETLPAAFQMEEILYELRERTLGLNLGRWDYIFSAMKALPTHPGRLMPDRDQLVMSQPFLAAAARLLVRTCHRRGAHAIGGMAAHVPSRSDPAATAAALRSVEEDKLREVEEGFDGTWVAHPDLVPVAQRAFAIAGANQLHRLPVGPPVLAEDLLAVPTGTRSVAGIRGDLAVSLRYLAAWLRGQGCIPLQGRMEDAATAEISRTLVWQWVRHGGRLADGGPASADLVARLLGEVIDELRAELGERYEADKYPEASGLLQHVCLDPGLTEFVTLPAYAMLED